MTKKDAKGSGITHHLLVEAEERHDKCDNRRFLSRNLKDLMHNWRQIFVKSIPSPD
jgi:hypothetical protein